MKVCAPAFSKKTILLGLVIIFSACFVRKIYNYLLQYITRQELGYVIFFLLIVFCIAFSYYVRKNNLNFFQWTATICIFFIIGFLSLRLKLIEERIHLVEYALLGIFAARDNQKTNLSFLYSAIFVSFIGLLDEIYQYFLPGRYFDWRDVFFNFVGGSLGGLLYIVSKRRVPK
ncbi:MAG: VanZ family protein [Candidatus Omnitrophota bacterium]